MFFGVNMFWALLSAHFSPRYARAKMSLSRAQNIFTPVNINYIVLFAKFNCSPKVDQGRDTIEAKRCRTHIRGQHTQRKMETWKNCGHLYRKRWKNSHSKGSNQERNDKQTGAETTLTRRVQG